VTSALPPLPLLQQYDRYVRLQTLSNELLDDILPRIRRQLSQIFASAEARVQRELAAPYAHALLKQASQIDSDALAQQIAQHLRPGPYRDLLDWWRRFKQFRVGRADEQRALALASRRADEKVDAWLYELWIALEFIHLLAREEAIEPQDFEIVTDLLQCTFIWQQRGFRFLYNRQLDTSTTYVPAWEHGPAEPAAEIARHP
jgi:hypothetical protein